MPNTIRLSSSCTWPCGCIEPPMTPKLSHGASPPAPSGCVTNAGMMVWNGRFPGATVFGSPGSSVNPAPRSCSANPVPGTTTPEPKASYSELMNDTMLPLESATVR